MHQDTLLRLRHFVGKVCYIYTTQAYRPYEDEQGVENFFCKITDITPDGVFAQNLRHQVIHYYTWTNIISLQEAVPVMPKDVPMKPDELSQTQASFIDIRSLKQVADETKKAYQTNRLGK